MNAAERGADPGAGPGASRSGASVTWHDLRRDLARTLASHEARLLVGEVSGLDPSGWSVPATAAGARRLAEMAGRRRRGEPLQYILGRWSFRGLDLLVDGRVLIPRPETEITAGVALAVAARGGAGRPGPPLVADLGTGSGAVALAVAAELPGAEVWATDRSSAALDVARANLSAVGPAAARVHLVDGDWFGALPDGLAGRLDLVVSNPPYISEAEWPGLPADVRAHEPRDALVAGPTGLECLEILVDGGIHWLAPGGALVCELAPHQAATVADRARRAGFTGVAVHRDLAGRDRIVVARRP